MMNNIQKYIDFLKPEKEKAEKCFKSSIVGSNKEAYEFGKSHAFSFAIEQAELLLLNEPAASAETAPCANAVLGDSAANVESSTSTQPAGGLGETPAVRQNEGANEVCPECEHVCCICWDGMR